MTYDSALVIDLYAVKEKEMVTFVTLLSPAVNYLVGDFAGI